MAIDRRAWEARQQEEGASASINKQVSAILARLRQAAVPLERLTGSEHWDHFLRLAEAIQEEDRTALRAEQERMAALYYLPPEAVATVRHTIAVLQASIDARQQVIDLPKSIIAEVQKVRTSSNAVTQ